MSESYPVSADMSAFRPGQAGEPASHRILVALSGGVDSAVAAALLKQQGHDIACVYMRTWMDEEGSGILADCPWEEDIRSAREVAQHLGVPFRILNLIDHYREKVVQYLVDGYRRGQTPNPDIMCNRQIKFGVLLDFAKAEGFDALATGHYVRVQCPPGGLPMVSEGVDENKNQAYFLAMVKRQAFESVCFPVGTFHKAQVRELARQFSLPNAERKDSQGICFLGRVPINRFLKQYIPDRPGPIINHRNEVIGQHRGLHHFTIGQRKGLGVPSNTDFEHYVVVAKDFANAALYVAFDHLETQGLWHQQAIVSELNAIQTLPEGPTQLLARPRYRDPLVSVSYTPLPDNRARIEFESPQRALAPGQVVAFYRDKQLIGGGYYSEVSSCQHGQE